MNITVQIMQILKNYSVSLFGEQREGSAKMKLAFSKSVLKSKGIGKFPTLWCYNTFEKYILKTFNVVINS